MINKNLILFIPGFYGVSERGDITTFGRGGSDYSAALIAVVSGAESLEVWKDVDGYLGADPKFIPESQLIPEFSYDEAAELSYFGAKIFHPRTVEPLRKGRLMIAVKNTLNPDAVGSVITHRRRVLAPVVKSVAYTDDIGILKVHASGVGARLGVLSLVSGELAENEINIKPSLPVVEAERFYRPGEKTAKSWGIRILDLNSRVKYLRPLAGGLPDATRSAGGAVTELKGFFPIDKESRSINEC